MSKWYEIAKNPRNKIHRFTQYSKPPDVIKCTKTEQTWRGCHSQAQSRVGTPRVCVFMRGLLLKSGLPKTGRDCQSIVKGPKNKSDRKLQAGKGKKGGGGREERSVIDRWPTGQVSKHTKLAVKGPGCNNKAGLPQGSALKNPPEMQEMRIQSLGGKDPLEEEMATTPVFLPEEFHGQGSLAGYSPQRHKELDRTEATKHNNNKEKQYWEI